MGRMAPLPCSSTRTSTCTGKFRAPTRAFTRESHSSKAGAFSRTIAADVVYMRSDVSSGPAKSWRSTLSTCAAPRSSKNASRAYSCPVMNCSSMKSLPATTLSGYISAQAAAFDAKSASASSQSARQRTVCTPMLQNPRAGFTTNGICGSSSAKSSFPSSSAVHSRKKKSSSICAKSLRMATLSLNTVMACVRLGLSACAQIHSSVFSELVYTRSPAERREAASASSTRRNARPDAKAVRSENALRSTGCCEDSSHSNNCGEAYGSSRMTTATPFSSGRRKRGPSKHNKRVYPHQPKAARPASSRHAKSSARQA